MDAKHTPLPWKILELIDGAEIRHEHGFHIADLSCGKQAWGCPVAHIEITYEECQANASFIVKAVNEYDRDKETIRELVEALKGIIEWERHDCSECEDGCPYQRAEQALKKAGAV